MEFSHISVIWGKVKLTDIAIVNMGQSPSSPDFSQGIKESG